VLQYADDTQLFIAVRASTIQSKLSVIEVCSTLVQQWIAINELLLNPDKSEIIVFGTSAQLKSAAAVNTVTVAGLCLPLTTEGQVTRRHSRQPPLVWQALEM
jgi:hypothetical protein